MKHFEKLKSAIQQLATDSTNSGKLQEEDQITFGIALNNIEMLANTIELEIDSFQYEEK